MLSAQFSQGGTSGASCAVAAAIGSAARAEAPSRCFSFISLLPDGWPKVPLRAGFGQARPYCDQAASSAVRTLTMKSSWLATSIQGSVLAREHGVKHLIPKVFHVLLTNDAGVTETEPMPGSSPGTGLLDRFLGNVARDHQVQVRAAAVLVDGDLALRAASADPAPHQIIEIPQHRVCGDDAALQSGWSARRYARSWSRGCPRTAILPRSGRHPPRACRPCRRRSGRHACPARSRRRAGPARGPWWRW